MNNKVNSVLNSIEKIDNLIMEADVSVSDAMSDVYSKQFKMEGNVTEDYINHEYYQESVIAGILIGGGIIAVLATAIVLITKHVKKSASGDPEKKNDTSTAAGTALDNQEELKKKVEQIKGELTKAGGSVEITNNGINTAELNKKFELVTKLCDSAEGFLKEKEDDLIKQEIENFTKQLEEINNIQYKSSETVTVSADSLTKIIDLAAPIKTMNDKLTKTAEELTKRSKENKNKSDSETDSDKKEKYNELKEGLERISKDSTQLSKDLTDDLNAIRSYMDAILKAAKEKAKPSETESEKSQETPQNPDILKQKIYPITAKWASTPSNSDPNHPGVKFTADEAYNIIDSIHDNVVNHRALNVLDTLKAKANEDPTKAMLIKNLIEATIDNKDVFNTEDEETINDIKSGLPELEKIAANAPSEEPKKDETKPESEEPKEGTNESGEKITISKDGGALYDIITSWSDIEKFKSALNGGNVIIASPIKKSYNNELLLTNTGKTEGSSTKFEITFGSEEEKRLISSFLNILDNFLNNEELFNKIPPELQKKLINTFDMFLKRNKEVIDNNGDEAWTNIQNKFNDLKEKYTGSKETSDTQTDGDLIKNKLSTISTGDEETKTDEPKTGTKEKKNNVITIAKNDNALYDLINGWKSLSAFESVFGNPSLAEKRIDRAYREESALSAKNSPTQLSKVQTIEMVSTNETYTNFVSNLDDTLKNINEHPDLLEKISDASRKNLVDAFTYFFNRNKEAIDQHNDGMWPSILSRYEEMYNTYKGDNDSGINKKIKTIASEVYNKYSVTLEDRWTVDDLINKLQPFIDDTDSAMKDLETNVLKIVSDSSIDNDNELSDQCERYIALIDSVKRVNNEMLDNNIDETKLNEFQKMLNAKSEDINEREVNRAQSKPNGTDSDNSENNDYIIQDSGILYMYEFIFPDEDELKKAINNVDEFNKNINDIENNSKQLDKITDKTEIEKELNRLIQTLDIIEKGVSFDNITNVAPLFVRVLKVIKEYTENSISISDSNPLHSKVTDIKDKVDKLISEYSALKPDTPTDQNDSENTETTNTTDESTPETSQNTDESNNQNGSENSDETKKQPEPKIEYPTISGFNGLFDLVSKLVSSGSIKRIVKNKKSGVDIDKLIAKAYNAEKTLQNKGTLTGDNAVRVLSNLGDEEEMLEKINTALTNITSDIKHFNNLTKPSKTKLVAAFEIFLNRNKFSGNQNIIDLKRDISKSLSFIKSKSNVNTGSAITAAQDTTTPQNDTDSNQQDQNSPQTQQSQPESTSPQSEPKSDDMDTKSLPTVSDLISNGDVDKIVEAYNQTASPSNKIDSGEISFFKNSQNQIKTNNLKDVFNEFIKIHNVDLNGPISKSVFQTLLSTYEDVIECHDFESNLNSFLSIKYEKYQNNPSRKQQIFDEAKKYAEMKNINVTLTKPDSEQFVPGTKSEVKSATDTTADTKPKTLRWFIENPEVSVDYVNKNLSSNGQHINEFYKDAMTSIKNNNLIDVIEKYGEDSGRYNLDNELTWSGANRLSVDVYTLGKIYKNRNNINDYLQTEYSDSHNNESMKDVRFYLAKTCVELHGGPNELLKPDGTMVPVTPAKTPTQSADNTQPKNTNQDGNNTPPTQTEMAKLKNHTLVHDVVTEANQRDEDGVPMITNDMETELKNASEEHLMDFIGHFITELTGNHTMIETIPFTRRNIITLAAYAKQANKLLKSQNNLRDFLTQQYEYYKDPAQQEYIYKMAKLFAQDYNISVVLTDPSGKKEYINPTTTFN